MKTTKVARSKQSSETNSEPGEPAVTSGETKKWIALLAKSVCSPAGLDSVLVPRRELILGDWFKEGDLGFIYGPRGLGKTWIALHMARAVNEGTNLGAWQVHKPRRVLYIDGEMPLDGIQERDAALTRAPVDGIFYLQHEILFHGTGEVLNLTNANVQKAVLEFCLTRRIEVMFLDNLSCLFSGVRENGADDWELVLPWLLQLRRNRIAVVFLAHAGRNGFMRGTSRREDAAFWMIELSASDDFGKDLPGTQFTTRFMKNRNATEAECPPLAWHYFKAGDETLVQVRWRSLSGLQEFRQQLEVGITSASKIAANIGISKGQVSKLATKAILEGWLKKAGREYALVQNN